MAGRKKKVLILLENEQQYKEYVRRRDEFADWEQVICALTPLAMYYCEMEKLPFILPEKCFSEEEYYINKKISEERIKKLISLLNEWSSALSHEQVGFATEIGNYFAFMLYNFFGSLHYRAFFLSSIIESEKPDRVIVFKIKMDSSINDGFFLVYGNCYSDLLLNSIYQDICVHIPYDNQVSTKKVNLKSSIKKIAKRVVSIIPGMMEQYLLCRSDIGCTLFRNLGRRYKKRLLVVGSLYGWEYALSQPKIASDTCISLLSEFNIPQANKRLESDLFGEWFGWEDKFAGFNLTPLTCQQMARVKYGFDEIAKSHHRISKWLLKFDVVVAAVSPYPFQNYILHRAKSLGKPVVFYQHGEMNLYPDSLWSEFSELLYLDYYLSFGEGVNSKYLPYTGNLRNFKGPISIGSASLDQLRDIRKLTGRYILYASTKYLSNSTPFIDVIGIDNKLYQAQKKILKYLEGLASEGRRYNIVWKLTNNPFTDEVLFDYSNSKIKIVRLEKNFVELIPDATLVVLDLASTTCLEVCATDKPLFVFMGSTKWFKEPKELLRKRAVVAESPEALVEEIDRYIKTGHYPADVKNREFIRAYGTHLDDGRSAERAADFLLSLMNN